MSDNKPFNNFFQTPNEYPEAGTSRTPRLVRRAITQYRRLPKEKRAKQPLLYWLLGSGTPPYKMSKQDSNYTDGSVKESQNCGNCKFAYQNVKSKKYICSQVSGGIAPKDWCKLWKP